MNKLIRLGLTLLVPTLLVGCWDSIEINNRSVILEFAIDKNIEHKYDPNIPLDDQNIYNIVYTIPDMAKLSGTESLATDMETSIIVQAPTIATSLDDLETKTRNTITFSHVKGLMIGENLLKDAELFKQVIDSISRDRLMARNIPILAVKGDATKIATIENAQQPVTGLYIMNYFNNKERPRSYFKTQLLGNFIRDMQDTGVATMPIFHLPKGAEEEPTTDSGQVGQESEQSKTEEKQTGQDDNEIDISGGAVIKDYKLVDYITKEEVRGQLFIQGEIKNATVPILFKGSPITYTVKEEKSKLKFEQTDNGLVCTVKIETKGGISEYTTAAEEDIFDKDRIKEIEEVMKKEIARQAQMAIDKSKEINADFLQIGLELYRKHPKWWEEYESTWEQGTYERLPILIEVDVTIENTGILQ
ncbi:MAG: Ger(x)C family spore germination protein [Cellulosilyticaceae bacterium]